MAIVSRGFQGRRRLGEGGGATAGRVPPGQYLVDDFPVLTAGPTPEVSTHEWELTITGAIDRSRRITWDELLALPSETFTTDLHCVTKWSQLDMVWTGVSLDVLFADAETAAEFVIASSYGGYTTNLALEDVLDGKAWVAYEYDGEPLEPEHGGPARLLVPHLYLWKSAKWLHNLELADEDEPGFWEGLGYHNRGDPWQEERYWGD